MTPTLKITHGKKDVEMIYAGIWRGSVFGFSTTIDGEPPKPKPSVIHLFNIGNISSSSVDNKFPFPV